ncbi:MAG TPA: alpha-amylase [Chloroflexi bacterium]|nr:alpha-amylase [Chloroflexota bacterium]
MGTPLSIVRDRLARAAFKHQPRYEVPGWWCNPHGPPLRRAVRPHRFYLRRINEILSSPPHPSPADGERGWSRQAVTYSLLVRATTAFDHDGDGEIAPEPTEGGWRETGTFLKSIALLPTLRQMGFNTLHLLPITAIGQYGKKGNLGSIYAVQNPYRLDPLLAEPALGLDVETELAAFVEAAHRLGMRVVVEFALRTAALDADWVAEHPEWFYWIRADIPDRQATDPKGNGYGPPLFPPEELARIKEQVARGDLKDLPPPPATYRAMFLPPPPAHSVHKEGGQWIGILPDGTRVRIPGAFADWPPDDPQPPWTDVTYLRLYDHPDFNYIAYNTIRMYDERLAQAENRVESLWQRITQIIPSYQRRFGIDGALLDMGHALPGDLKRRIVEAARQIDPGFAFWSETFSYDGEAAAQGYDAVVGNYWWLVWRPSLLLEGLLRPLTRERFSLPFLAAPETHNTPRAAARPGGLTAARAAWALGCLLPGIPFCHSGLELGETLPVNTGLDFSPEEVARYPAERLPLFSTAAYGWESESHLIDWIRRTLAIRRRFADLVTNPDPATFDLVPSDNPHVWAVVRRSGEKGIAIVINTDPSHPQSFTLHLPPARFLLGDSSASEGHLPPAGCALFDLGSGASP